MITEDQLEQQCLDWFKSQGYSYAIDYEIALVGISPEREDENPGQLLRIT